MKEGLNDGVVKHLSASDRALDRLNLIPCHYRITLTATIVWLSIDTVPNPSPPSYWFSHPETVCSQRAVNYRAFYRELHLHRKLYRDTDVTDLSRSLPETIVRNWTFGALFSHFRHALTQPHKQRFPSSRKQMYDLSLWHSKIIYMAFYLYGTVGGAGTGNTWTGKETKAMTRDLPSWIGLRLQLLQNCFSIQFFQKSERDSSPQNKTKMPIYILLQQEQYMQHRVKKDDIRQCQK